MNSGGFECLSSMISGNNEKTRNCSGRNFGRPGNISIRGPKNVKKSILPRTISSLIETHNIE